MKAKLASGVLVVSLAVTALAQGAPPPLKGTQTNNTKPNIVFILLDNLGYRQRKEIVEATTFP